MDDIFLEMAKHDMDFRLFDQIVDSFTIVLEKRQGYPKIVQQ